MFKIGIFAEKSQCTVNMKEIGKIIKERRKSLKVNQLELLRTGGRGHQYAGGHRAWRRQS